METNQTGRLPFSNVSLKKVLALEPDTFKKAKLQIVFTILAFAFLKLAIVIFVSVRHHLDLQLLRGLILLLLLLLTAKLLLWRPKLTDVAGHIIIVCTLAVAWTNMLVYAHGLNIITLQIVFFSALLSYYLIGGSWGLIYTLASMTPLLYVMFFGESGLHLFKVSPQEMSQETMNTVLILNFITFARVHYLYYRAFTDTLREKDALNTQLEQNVSNAQALAQSRSLFLSTMSHELRTPLNGVIGMTQLLRDSANQGQSDQLEILEFSANTLLAVINDVLDYNKIELNRIELEKLPVNLSRLVKKIASGLELQAREKGLALIVEVDDELEKQQVICDPTRLTQILYNLVGNAVKFTEEGSVSIKIRIAANDSDSVKINFTISDTGIGIPPDRLEAIFEPFIQASSTTTRQYGGTGLGLAIVKKLLILLNSSIKVESRMGEGTQFLFDIVMPWCKDINPVVSTNGSGKQCLQGLRVLIAEDNRINVLLLEKLLSKWQVNSITVKNGEDAVKMLQQHNFDAILMDIHMPGLDGYGAAKAIRGLSDPDKKIVPIIALTASASHDLPQKIRLAGMQDQLTKPFQPEQLYESLLRICDANASKNNQVHAK